MSTDCILIATNGSWTGGLLARELRRQGKTVFVASGDHEAINWVTLLRNCGNRLKVVVLAGYFPLEDMRILAREIHAGGGLPSLLVLGENLEPSWVGYFEGITRVNHLAGELEITSLATEIEKLSSMDMEQAIV